MKKLSVSLVMLALALAFGLAFVGCANGVASTAEEAFEDVWEHFNQPRLENFGEGRAFNFCQKSFNSADLQAVKAYWDSLPGTYYTEDWGPDSGGDSNLRFQMQVRGQGDNAYNVIVVFYPNEHISIAHIAPGKVLEIAKTMVDRVK